MTAPLDITALTSLVPAVLTTSANISELTTTALSHTTSPLTTSPNTTTFTNPTTKPKRLLLLTHPRSASHLFLRILSLPSQPHLFSRPGGGYYFFPLLLASSSLRCISSPLSIWSSSEKATMFAKYQDCFDDLEADVVKAEEKGMGVFVKEHACFMGGMGSFRRWRCGGGEEGEGQWTVSVPGRYRDSRGGAAGVSGEDPENEGTEGGAAGLKHSTNNITALPDAYLMSWHPTFLIRHPALAIPSYRRATKASNEKLEADMTLHWQRSLFDFYHERRGLLNKGRVAEISGGGGEQVETEWPAVIDADDVMHNPSVVERWCRLAGLDVSKLQYQWAPLSEEEKAAQSAVAKKFTVTLSGSAGVVEGKSAKGCFGVGGEEWDGVGNWEETETPKWMEEFGEETTEWIVRRVKESVGGYKYLWDRRVKG